ncbi:MAG TPA: bacillithiol biosynthesis BshC, partial [Planctomycetota bacterium]|nr:bacillithiol biosynthesis BshC [Planctomycetota bacterium]
MSAAPSPASGPLSARRPAIVHASWTADWWQGDGASATRSPSGTVSGTARTVRSAALEAAFGSAPSLAALAAAADARARAGTPREWTTLLHGPAARDVPADALVVVAGQQPVLLGGAALVAHKAATAIALAKLLAREWRRPVVPVFLLATEDHDTSEVDHL